jgi:hypothetical protein
VTGVQTCALPIYSKNVTIKRIVGGKPDTIKVNTKRLEDANGGSFQVLPGDIITVGESWY